MNRQAFPLFALLICAMPILCFGQQTEIVYLSGTGNDNTVDWEFYVTGGRGSGVWTTIPVPSNWELHGFGTYNYGHDEPKADEQGLYRHRFQVPERWQGNNIQIVFEGSMTDTEVRINGKLAGPVHQGAFYRFQYDITDLLTVGGENLLEVTVSKMSANESVNEAERQADFWVFGGIFRPVYLEVHPEQFIERTALDARANGDFRIDVFSGHHTQANRVAAQVYTLDGQAVGETFSAPLSPADTVVTLRSRIPNPRTWTPEFPHRYRVEVRLQEDGQDVHVKTETFGFRTVEVRPQDGIYVNGVKVRMKGVNRHTFWPTSGRTTNRALSEQDVQLMKDMNMNAVRMSHYPPDPHFLEVCDSLGLFVLDELTGWQDAYDTEVGAKLVRETVIRDVNHPSVIFWMNGNEGGWNTELVDHYARYDPQNRVVLHAWDLMGDIDTVHYQSYNCCAGEVVGGKEIFMPTEFLHGLYDGGHGAGLEDWWNLMLRHPRAAGGFLWVLADEGVVRTDEEGRIDTDGNHAPDGIVGPYREKEGSFYAIKEIWSPIFIEEQTITPAFNGQLPVENRYHYTNLNQVRFGWQLVRFPGPAAAETEPTVIQTGTVVSPDIAPGHRGMLNLDLGTHRQDADALYLTATDPHGREVFTWSWMISTPEAIRADLVEHGEGRVTGSETDEAIVVGIGDTEVRFDKTTGRLAQVMVDGQGVSLSNGPRLVTGTASLTGLAHRQDGSDYVVEATFEGNLKTVVWRVFPSGWVRLDYTYVLSGEADYLGVTFDYPEDGVRGMTWLGQGPYRVWKNRLKGQAFGVWQKAYNDGITGEVWTYPEFKGYHADLYWAAIDTDEVPITVVTDTDGLYLGAWRPKGGADPRTTAFAYPEGDLSFLHGISPIGTKFHPPEHHGPMSRPNMIRSRARFETTLYFHFGPLGVAR